MRFGGLPQGGLDMNLEDSINFYSSPGGQGKSMKKEDIRIKMFSHGEIREKNTNGMRE